MDDKRTCHSETNLPALKALSRFLLSHLFGSPCYCSGSLVCGRVVGASVAGGTLLVQLLTKAGQGPRALPAGEAVGIVGGVGQDLLRHRLAVVPEKEGWCCL